MIHTSSHSCSFYSNMTFSLHWIFTQAHILLTTAKCLEAKRFSNSLPTPRFAVLVIPPDLAHHSVTLYSTVFYCDWLHATRAILSNVSLNHGTFSLVTIMMPAAFWFILLTIFALHDLSWLHPLCPLLVCPVLLNPSLNSDVLPHPKKMLCPALVCLVLPHCCQTNHIQPYSTLIQLTN